MGDIILSFQAIARDPLQSVLESKWKLLSISISFSFIL